MTYSARETSVEGGQPVELYEFTRGVEKTRYTSSEDQITFNSFQWYPRAISRSQIGDNNEGGDVGSVNITLPSSDDLAQRYIGIMEGTILSVRIWRFHRGDTEAYLLWDGAVTGSGFTERGRVCVLETYSASVAFSRSIGRVKYLSLCNHVLYGEGCDLDPLLFDYDGNVSSVSASVITVDGLFAANGAGWAVGGYVQFGSDYRLVLAQSGDDLTLLFPFAASPASETVKVFAGCDHTATTCNSKFSNILNFGGYPYVPGFNVFRTGLN